MASIKNPQTPLRSFSFQSISLHRSFPHLKKPGSVPFSGAFFLANPKRFKILRSIGRGSANQNVVQSDSENGTGSCGGDERPPFDLNLAVVLAGFAFEAYNSPPENVGWLEVDAVDCQTVFLSESFLREVYDGQLFIKLKKGVDLPAMDPWGTSDPYVVLQLEGQVAKSKIKWATKEPIWNEDFTFNIKTNRTKFMQIAVWDANLVTPHKRMGNAGVNLESICDGNLHELVVELEGIGGGGKIHLEVKYRSYEQIERDRQWWRIPFVSDFLTKSSLGSVLKMVIGSESVNASEFVKSAFGQLSSFTYTYLQIPSSSDSDIDESKESEKSFSTLVESEEVSKQISNLESSVHSPRHDRSPPFEIDGDESTLLERKVDSSSPSEEYFWKAFGEIINKTVLQRFGFSLPEIKMWDEFDLLNTLSLQSRKIAEKEYVESGLATMETTDNKTKNDLSSTTDENSSSLLDIKKVSWDVLRQTETIFGALMVLSAPLSQQKNDSPVVLEENKKDSCLTKEQIAGHSMNMAGLPAIEESLVDTRKAEEMRQLFSSAESAMEAWAMLATSLGRKSFIKSDFEKICFLDNVSTDTQVAIWRDPLRRRLVIAFRGTEQTKWKDLQTDLMLAPSGLNPERLGGDFKQEVQVHSGFLNAYDSIRNRIMTLVKFSVGYIVDDDIEILPKWHVYVTGHSLGGALATLMALELSSSRMAKHGAISVTMYNFGSPRVGNRRFAEVYNAKVKDSWRIVNHRDIIPTVPRLMGYCHVAEPVYLSIGDLKDASIIGNVLDGGKQGDVIGESTPDVLVSEFMKGEKRLVEKILQTEINLLHSIRDGTALMQHMEDFYYVTLLERVRSNYQLVDSSSSNEEGISLKA
ncbi:uncharacterized protein [Typha latifolia]|uniref:uncharacterized protein isoform X1 n=1 Tax=Typha latifolia TaxID=4733 RepID=UPI003C30B576